MEKDTLYSAIENLSDNAIFELKIDKLFEDNLKAGFDGQLFLSCDSLKFKFFFTVKNKLTFSKLPHIELDSDKKFVLISDYISKSLKKYLKEKHISYIDGAGNAFITNEKGLLIYIETNKNIELSTGKSNRAFSKAGLKVIFQVLVDEKLVNAPYRQIGELSTVSIDTVGRVFKELLRDKYLVQITEKKYKLQNKERLLQEWVTIFNKILRPKLKQRKYKLKKNGFHELMKAIPGNSIGGELAAEYLSNYLIAESAVIYTDKPFVDLAMDIGLLPAKDGAITVVEKFWSEESTLNQGKIVNPILVYADLLDNPNPRNLKTANLIYNKYVKNTL